MSKNVEPTRNKVVELIKGEDGVYEPVEEFEEDGYIDYDDEFEEEDRKKYKSKDTSRERKVLEVIDGFNYGLRLLNRLVNKL